MTTHRVLCATAAVAALLVGTVSAGAATGSCDEGVLGYRISSPAAYQETGGHTVVVGLAPLDRTVAFHAAEDSGCVIEPGDPWSVTSPYFQASGTYDGTPASLTAAVAVAVPRSDADARRHEVGVALDGVVDSSSLFVKRRTRWEGFNVSPERPAPTCGATTMEARGRLLRVSWSAGAFRPYAGRTVHLLSSPGTTAEHELEDAPAATTAADGWARWRVVPRYDATWTAHADPTGTAGHADSTRDSVDCVAR